MTEYTNDLAGFKAYIKDLAKPLNIQQEPLTPYQEDQFTEYHNVIGMIEQFEDKQMQSTEPPTGPVNVRDLESVWLAGQANGMLLAPYRKTFSDWAKENIEGYEND